MNHPAELTIHSYLSKVMKGEGYISEDNLDKITSDIRASLLRQFAGGSRKDFKLRMSNIGKPTCQLWYAKNKPDVAEALPSNFLMNMVLGDLVEAIFKGIMRESKVEFSDSGTCTLKVKDKTISGEYDMTIGDKVDDIKSASPWSFKNKFDSFYSLAQDDSFGYVSQLAGYAKAIGKKVGGWWVINKANGDFKYVSAENMDTDKAIKSIEDTIEYLDTDKPFKRCYTAVFETYRNVSSGNKILPNGCKFCPYKKDCWSTLRELPSKVSKASIKPLVEYVELKGETQTL